MFVLTIKSKFNKNVLKHTFLGAILFLCVVLLLFGAVALCDKPESGATCKNGEYNTAFNKDNPQEFVKQFDKKIKELYKQQEVFIPGEFDDTYSEYNELQKQQGLNLEKYKGKLCQLYIYKLSDYTIDYNDAYISIIVYRQRVIGGHISTGIVNCELYTFYGD